MQIYNTGLRTLIVDSLTNQLADFIFTLFSEEFGFIGSVILLIIYAVLIYRTIKIGTESQNESQNAMYLTLIMSQIFTSS